MLKPVDSAIITVPFEEVLAAMADRVQKGVKAAVVLFGDIAETGKEGVKIERQSFEIGKCGGIRFVDPNCMGHFDTFSSCNNVIFRPPVRKGAIALISQKWKPWAINHFISI